MDKELLTQKAKRIRQLVLEAKYSARSGHIGTAFSAVELVVYLYYHFMNVDFTQSSSARDYFFLSKAHGSMVIYAMLCEQNIISKQTLLGIDTEGSLLGDHISDKIDGVEYSMGSLGHGLSVGCGVAYANRLGGINNKAIVMLGDGECNEGMIWEAASFAGISKMNNLIAIVDYNKFQGYGRTDELSYMEKFSQRWESFGWRAIEIDGHNFDEINAAFESIRDASEQKPTVIIAHTVKGKGVSFMENTLLWHYKSLNEENYGIARKELE